ncbi:MAG TPA: BrnA antitoxin family protein [Bauldia sp.]|nr:BrnA antitoxin family protein [Bauldia sp.]
MHERGETVPTAPDAPEIELDDDFWENAVVVMPGDPLPGATTAVELPVDAEVLAWFRRRGDDYLTRMGKVLRAYYRAHRKKAP